MIPDLRNDMKAECEKFGEVRKVIVFDVSIQVLQDMLLNLHEFAFEGKNMKFTVNMLLTCILYCAPGPAAIRTVCKHST